jgi:integrase
VSICLSEKAKVSRVRTGLTGKGPRRTTDTFKQYVGGFSGWKKIYDTLNSVNDNDTYNIFLGLIKFGCRAMELPTLKKRQINFNYSKTQIMVQGMLVEKQKEIMYLVDTEGKPLYENGKRKYEFKSKKSYRTFPIRKDEPLSKELGDYVSKFKDDEDQIFPYNNYNNMYYKIAKIGMILPPGIRATRWNDFKGPWWCHRIRSERACQLIRDLRYDTFRLQRWFGWTSSDMPEVYSTVMPTDLIEEKMVDWR